MIFLFYKRKSVILSVFIKICKIEVKPLKSETMKYKLVQKANPQRREQKKWYANAVNGGKVEQKDIAKTIASKSSLTSGDIANVVDNLVEEVPRELAKGNIVKLGDFGSFRISVSSEGVENEKDFNASMIKDIKVIFTPGVEMKKVISQITFEKE